MRQEGEREIEERLSIYSLSTKAAGIGVGQMQNPVKVGIQFSSVTWVAGR